MSIINTESNLILLPSSPSISEHEFSPYNSDSDVPSNRRILGVRELAAYARLKGKRPIEHREITIRGHPDEGIADDRGPEVDDGLQAVSDETKEAGNLFARNVDIKGWKTVGGSLWSDKAKLGAYVVFDIDIVLRSGGSINILRRYTDFVKLRNELKTAFPHLRATIPRLPGKKHMSKFSAGFLEDRQTRLQRFLRTVMLHPEMGKGGDDSVIGRWVIRRDST